MPLVHREKLRPARARQARWAPTARQAPTARRPGRGWGRRRDRGQGRGQGRGRGRGRGRARERSGGRATNFITCKSSLRSFFGFVVRFLQIQTCLKKVPALGSTSSILTTVSQKTVVENRPISKKRSERSRMTAESSDYRSKPAYRVSSVTPCGPVRETGVPRSTENAELLPKLLAGCLAGWLDVRRDVLRSEPRREPRCCGRHLAADTLRRTPSGRHCGGHPGGHCGGHLAEDKPASF